MALSRNKIEVYSSEIDEVGGTLQILSYSCHKYRWSDYIFCGSTLYYYGC